MIKSFKTDTVKNNMSDFDPTISRPSIFAKPLMLTEYTVHFSQEFEHPSYYDEVVSLLMSAEEGDQINFMINNFGGRVDTLNGILNAMSLTNATVNGYLIGQGCSCASVLFLACHNYVVGDNTTLMIHEQSFWVGGKANETKKQHEHYQKQNERFIKVTYQGFLTDEEIANCLKGEDFYFEDWEIKERLTKREELRKVKALEDLVTQQEKPIDLSELSTEELDEELRNIQLDLRDIKAEISKRKKQSKH